MPSFFTNLSIRQKILAGFAVVGAMAIILALFALNDIIRIRSAASAFMPHIAETEHLANIDLALGNLEQEIDRYTTVGGEENRERIELSLRAITENTAALRNISLPETAAHLDVINESLDRLATSIEQLVVLQEQFEKRGLNQQILRIFEDLEVIHTEYGEYKTHRNSIFTAAVNRQNELIREIFIQFTTFEVIVIAAALALSYVLARAITNPILTLRDSVARIAKGDYNVRARVQSTDEIGELASAFNRMADNLQVYTTDLESKIMERTEELHQKIGELNASNETLARRENELTLANDRLRELDKVKSEFISVAAHQLRTPLSALKWILGILIDENSDNLTAEQKSLLLKGNESNERMIRLINEMLVVTRLESGKVRYEFVPIQIEDLIDSTILDFSIQAHVRKIQLSFEKPTEPLPPITADSEKIRSVLQNLIENAMRYTPDEGSVTITAHATRGMVEVAVRDSGIGIPTSQQSNIFTKFFRADNAMKRQTDGSGLGLFIAKSVVEKHGGEIRFESAENSGTTFYFTIPVSTQPSHQ